MRICIFGAGAIGGHLAARFIQAGSGLVSVVARGAQLDAIQRNGVTLIANGERIWGQPIAATHDASQLPPQDLIFVTLKAHSAPLAAKSIARLLAPRGVAVFLLNGIPWWWNYGLPRNAALPLLDPDGALWNHLGRSALWVLSSIAPIKSISRVSSPITGTTASSSASLTIDPPSAPDLSLIF